MNGKWEGSKGRARGGWSEEAERRGREREEHNRECKRKGRLRRRMREAYEQTRGRKRE